MRTETYLTPDGYRDFEIRSAVDVQVLPSPDSDKTPKYDYKIVSFTENDMTIQMDFEDPDAISALGGSTDNLSVTFWSSELL